MNSFRARALHVLGTVYGSLPVSVFRNMMNCAANPEGGENPDAVLKMPPRSDVAAWTAHFAAYEAATRCISDDEAPHDMQPLVSQDLLDEIESLADLPADELSTLWRKQQFRPGAVGAALAICETAV